MPMSKSEVRPLWFYGNDPARDADYHTIVINGLFPRPSTGEWLPLLRDIYRIQKTDYLDVLNFLFDKLFKEMPPRMYVTDATRDPTFAELITRKLGANKVLSYKFTIDSKLHLMQVTKDYLKQGYALPDADELLRDGLVNPEKAAWIKELKIEALREQMKPTSGDKISFSDGGKHNDLLHGEALSLKGVYDYQKRAGFGRGRDSLFGYGASDPYDGRNPRQILLDKVGQRFENAGMNKDNMKFNVK